MNNTRLTNILTRSRIIKSLTSIIPDRTFHPFDVTSDGDSLWETSCSSPISELDEKKGHWCESDAMRVDSYNPCLETDSGTCNLSLYIMTDLPIKTLNGNYILRRSCIVRLGRSGRSITISINRFTEIVYDWTGNKNEVFIQ